MSRSRIVTVRSLVCLGTLLSTSCAFSASGEELDVEEVGSDSEALLPIDDDGEGPENPCLDDATGSLTATPSSIALGGSSTLQWNVVFPGPCGTARVYLNSSPVAKSGSLVVTPQTSSTNQLRISISGYGQRVVATAAINVQLPPQVNITSYTQVPLFLQAVQTPNTTVVISNYVNLNLSNREYIAVQPGVTIRGGRSGLEPGPRLYTTTRPDALLVLSPWSSNVRITGIRIEGPDMGVADRNGASAIAIDSATNVLIDHNELSGWAGSAIDVRDSNDTMGSPSPSATVLPTHTVRIQENYIHHNQAVGGDGYGVVASYGAHPYIARNTFDWNRHAIAGDGREGTGYTAYHNLVLEHGGYHRWIPFPGFWTHTHQFDMHGRNNCGVADLFSDTLFNCGPAGHTMLIRHNTFFYDDDNAIKLRGTPSVGMFVGGNVFAEHSTFASAVHQNESGLVEEPGNLVGFNGMEQLVLCDFDGDSIDDTFMATGASWWYRSGGTAPWELLNASTRKLSEINIGFFDSDNRCDVRADGVVFPGGKPGLVAWPGGGSGSATF